MSKCEHSFKHIAHFWKYECSECEMDLTEGAYEYVAELKARIALLEAQKNNAKHELEKCRMWNGSGYDWHPLHAKRAWEALQEQGE